MTDAIRKLLAEMVTIRQRELDRVTQAGSPLEQDEASARLIEAGLALEQAKDEPDALAAWMKSLAVGVNYSATVGTDWIIIRGSLAGNKQFLLRDGRFVAMEESQ